MFAGLIFGQRPEIHSLARGEPKREMLNRKFYIPFFIASLLVLKSVLLSAQNEGIILRGMCYRMDTIYHKKIHLGRACVALVSQKDQSLQNAKADKDGNFQFTLQPNTVYIIAAAKKGYLNSYKEIVSTMGITDPIILYQDIRFPPPREFTENQIRYANSDATDLDANDKVQLDTAYSIFKAYPELIIEIMGYTDCRGTVQHCDSISLLRAIVVKQYLVSKGIDSSRLIPRGYGKSNPVINCGCTPYRTSNERECTDIEDQMNNRIAIKILEGSKSIVGKQNMMFNCDKE